MWQRMNGKSNTNEMLDGCYFLNIVLSLTYHLMQPDPKHNFLLWFQIQMIAKLLGYKEVTGEFVAQKGGPSMKQLMENYKMCWYRFVLSIKVMHCNQPTHTTKFDNCLAKSSISFSLYSLWLNI